MMLHRKKSHPEETNKCKKYQHGECSFDKTECWYIHFERQKSIDSSEEVDSSENENLEQGFQKAQRKPVPPNRRN